jgi:hypothetical protein
MIKKNVGTLCEEDFQAHQVWNIVQDPLWMVDIPNGTMLLVSALGIGWQIGGVEMKPSWDQYGFIYLVTLCHSSHRHCIHIILAKNSAVEYLLFERLGYLFKN